MNIHEECRDGMYGANCSSTCGKCANSTLCNKENGSCSHGCQAQWIGPLCDGMYQHLNCGRLLLILISVTERSQ